MWQPESFSYQPRRLLKANGGQPPAGHQKIRQVKGTFQWLNFSQPEATSPSLIQSQQNTKQLSVVIPFKDILGEEKLTTGGAIDAWFSSATEWQRACLHAWPHLCMYISYWPMWTWEGGHEKHFDSPSALFLQHIGSQFRTSFIWTFQLFCSLCAFVCPAIDCSLVILRLVLWRIENRDTPAFD